MPSLDTVYSQFLSGSPIGRDTKNQGQNEDYFKTETTPGGAVIAFHVRNGNISTVSLDDDDLTATDWNLV